MLYRDKEIKEVERMAVRMRKESLAICADGIQIPEGALRVLRTLEDAGYETWAVGGFVRDALSGQACADVDLATAAPWTAVRDVCTAAGMRTHETGTKHGTITVMADGEPIEVTTFRADGVYKDARHPEQVTFVRNIEEDLARRDFTINAMAFHPERGLLDPFGGVEDLRRGVIRTVGDPRKRFAEDALRILRACRFVGQLGFRLDDETRRGMMENKGLAARMPAERVAHELERLLLGAYAGLALLETVDVLAVALPELVAMKGFDQHTPYHIYDVLEHTAHVVDGVPQYPLVRWAALMHDMGKPAAFFTDPDGTGHFYAHAAISVKLAHGIMARLKLPSAFQAQVLALVERHDDVIEPTPRAVKRALARLGGDVALFHALCDLKRGDTRGQAPRCAGRIEAANELERMLDGLLSADEAFSLKALAVNGRDAMAAGVPEGPAVGQALADALDAVIDECEPNEADALRSFLARWAAERGFGKSFGKGVDEATRTP